jgi:hypothetical protein
MPAPCFIAYNNATGALTGPAATQATAAVSGTVRTMLQIAPATTTAIRVIAWGYSFDVVPASNARVELIDTGAIFATGLTAHVAAGIHKYNVPAGTASTVQLGAALTGYNVAGAAAEGTITATRLLDYRYESGLYYQIQFPLGREPEIPAGNALRIRVTPTSAAALNFVGWVVWEE